MTLRNLRPTYSCKPATNKLPHFSNDADKAAFDARMQINKKMGANEHYTGDGTTKNLIASCPNKCGVMETFTYDKSPQTLANLEASGSAKRIPAKPFKVS